MPPSTPISDPHNVLHVYRHLLREISYLPPPARPWVAAHAVERFRARPLKADKLSEREHSLTLKKRLYKAHGAVCRLRAANSGHAVRMLNILFLAFGRRGRRRRELVEELVYRGGKAAKDAIAGGTQSRPSLSATHKFWKELEAAGGEGGEAKPERSRMERRWDWLEKWDTDRVKVYLKSQKTHEASVNTSWPSTATLRTTDPSRLIPDQNIWQRDWHHKTYRTKLAKAWKITVDKVQPPVPRHEWDMIRRIALNEGIPDEWKIPPRRTPVPLLLAPQGEGWQWEELATKPVRHIERPKAPRNIRLSGEGDVGPYGRESKGPAPDGRWIRRVFQSLWHTVSVVDKDPVTSKETITWGKKKYQACPASPAQSELFKGVNAKGGRQSSIAKTT